MNLAYRAITREEIPAWTEAMSLGFGRLDHPSTGLFAEAIFDDQRCSATFDGNRVVGTYVSFSVGLSMPGGTELEVNAVSGVTVSPSYRERGILRNAMLDDFRNAVDRGEAMSILFASEYSIYERFGFGPATEFVSLSIDTNGLVMRPFPGGDPLGRVTMSSPTEALVVCKRVYDIAHRQNHGSVSRPDLMWRRSFALMDHRPEYEWKGFLAVSYDETGEADGYVRLTLSTDWSSERPDATLAVDELVTTTSAAHYRIWKFLTTYGWVRKIVVHETRVDDPVRLLVTDPRRVQQTKRFDHLWARVLDVKKVLEARSYRDLGELTFRIVDDLGIIDGTYRLVVSPSGATCERLADPATNGVEVGASARSEAGAGVDVSLSTSGDQQMVPFDVELNASDFSSLVLGAGSPTGFATVGRLRAIQPDVPERMERLFGTTRQPWNPTRF